MRALVAFDGSSSANQAVDLVAGIEWPPGSTIQVVEAVENSVALFGGPWPTIAIAQADTLEAELLRGARESVEAARTRLARPGLAVDSAVLRGRPATEIVEAAGRDHADVIAVGSRGHGPIESMLLGSVSAEVVDHARVPVLVARGESIRRIVLAWDGSASARYAVDIVKSWPIFARSSLHVASVADFRVPWWAGLPEPGSVETMAMYADAADSSRTEHERLARELVDELRGAGFSAEPVLRMGDAASEIIAAAREIEADMIVVGTHGRTGLARLALGSVARNVLYHAGCSILIARDHTSTV